MDRREKAEQKLQSKIATGFRKLDFNVNNKRNIRRKQYKKFESNKLHLNNHFQFKHYKKLSHIINIGSELYIYNIYVRQLEQWCNDINSHILIRLLLQSENKNVLVSIIKRHKSLFNYEFKYNKLQQVQKLYNFWKNDYNE